jgi:hypothetical protein
MPVRLKGRYPNLAVKFLILCLIPLAPEEWGRCAEIDNEND